MRARGVKVLFPYHPWDRSTEGQQRNNVTDPMAMAEMLKATCSDGFNGDTMHYIPEVLLTLHTVHLLYTHSLYTHSLTTLTHYTHSLHSLSTLTHSVHSLHSLRAFTTFTHAESFYDAGLVRRHPIAMEMEVVEARM